MAWLKEGISVRGLGFQQFWDRLLLGQHGRFISPASEYDCGFSLGPVVGAEPPLWPFLRVQQVTQGVWAVGCPSAGLSALLQGAFRMGMLIAVLIIEILQS